MHYYGKKAWNNKGKNKSCGCGCGHKAGSHKETTTMKDVIDSIYNMKGENYLDPGNKSISEGFWSAGQPNKTKFYAKYGSNK